MCLGMLCYLFWFSFSFAEFSTILIVLTYNVMHIKCKYRRAVCIHMWCFSCFYYYYYICNEIIIVNVIIIIIIIFIFIYLGICGFYPIHPMTYIEAKRNKAKAAKTEDENTDTNEESSTWPPPLRVCLQLRDFTRENLFCKNYCKLRLKLC